ncbi:MAG: universal stress protein [Rhodobacteraceae bacterium]|nr:universal stress protein [Paracoccaceae bacterium]
MYDTILIAAALFNKGQTTRGLIRKASGMLNPGGKLVLVHVIDEIPQYAAARIPAELQSNRQREAADELEAIAAEAGGIKVETVVRMGTPSAGILGTASETRADLIMIASHKPGFGDYFIGSTATRVVRHAQTSVLVLR